MPSRAKGIPIINLPGVQVETGEVPMATIVLPNFEPGHYLVMATRRGQIKKTPLEQFERVRATGIRAITIHDNDELAWVDVSSGKDDIIIATAEGMIARFAEEHGFLDLSACNDRPQIGDVVRVVPNHVCVVVNMVDRLVTVRGDRIVGELPVAARGRLT